MQPTQNKPVAKFQAGGVSAALWRNQTKLRNGDEIETLSVTLDRRYKDQGGEWQSSGSFRLNDIPKAVLVLLKAYSFIVGEQSGRSTEDGDNGAAPPNVPEEVVM